MAITKTTKVDDFTMSVESSETLVSAQIYDYDFLIGQRDRITTQRDSELAIINSLISEAEKLGLKSKKETDNEVKSEEILNGIDA